MSPREQAALSAMGAALAEHCEAGDVLETSFPKSLIDEVNYTLRPRGLVVRPSAVSPDNGLRLWRVETLEAEHFPCVGDDCGRRVLENGSTCRRCTMARAIQYEHIKQRCDLLEQRLYSRERK